MNQRLVHFVLFALAGALSLASAAWIAGSDLPEPRELGARSDWRLSRPRGAPDLVVSPEKRTEIPILFADFELRGEWTFQKGAELDLVVRRLDPNTVDGGPGPYHGRFSMLRFSTAEDGPVFVRREEALFGTPTDELGGGPEKVDMLQPVGGVGVDAEKRVELVVRGRGRQIELDYRGETYGPFETRDERGAFALIARFGDVAIHKLEILGGPEPEFLGGMPASVLGWSGGLGLLLGVLGALVTKRTQRALWFATLPAGGFVFGAVVLDLLMLDLHPSPMTWVFGLTAGFGATLGGVLGGPKPAVLGLLWCAPALELSARADADRLWPLEDARLDALLGPNAANLGFEAYAGICRSLQAIAVADPFEVEPPRRVLLMGGGPTFDDPRDPQRSIAREAVGRASIAGNLKLEAVVDGRTLAHFRQQWEIADRIWIDRFQPEIVVLALGPWEGDASERPSVRDIYREGFARRRPLIEGSWLLQGALDLEMVEPVVPTEPDEVFGIVEAFAARAEEFGFDPLLVVAVDAPPGYRDAIGNAADRFGVRLERLPLGTDTEASVRQLTTALQELTKAD